MSTGTADVATAGLPRQILNVVAFGIVITVNALANALPINGVTSGAVSDMYPTLITPAGYVFSIWGLIYAWLAVFTSYQALPAQRDNPRLQRLGSAFAVSCACNAAWLFAWHHQRIALAWALIVALLVTLMVCYERLRGGPASRGERFALLLPFSVYLGWVTVATTANTAILLVDLGVDGGAAAPWWGAVAIAAATAVGLTVLVRRADSVFCLVLVWAFAGIAVAQGGRSGVVLATTALASLALLAAVAWDLVARRAVRRTGV